MITEITQPKSFFDDRGGLHDARIIGMSWDQVGQIISISIDDLNSNFLDLPEYEGFRPALLKFNGVRLFDINVQNVDGYIRVYGIELDIQKHNETYTIQIKCAPGGLIKFDFKSASME